MATELLDIQPRELEFVFELKKQSTCSIRLVNKTQQHVAFKVKTTSPKKYCVRPNIGIVMPKSTCEFTVTMQAHRSLPPDMTCKDKFLIQSTVVPASTTDTDITSEVFNKGEGKYIEENKLRVLLISPPESPILSPINGALEEGIIEPPAPKVHLGWSDVDFIKPEPKVAKAVYTPKVANDNESPEKDTKIKTAGGLLVAKDAEPNMMDEKDVKVKSAEDIVFMSVAKGVDPYRKDEKIAKSKLAEEIVVTKDAEPYAKDINLCSKDDVLGMNLVKDITEMKTKLSKLESKLGGAEATISKLIEERKSITQEREILKEELALLRSRKSTRTVHDGFPLLFVVMVALISVAFGYLSH